ncbi:Hypothetical predicted protein [Paramuricea clavata]|uniref:Uncharacterized protein n=1 Tax=Paramuricea clavata TaxID=317549 RepID=A0A6S7KGA3_PARCT|nr:Hypothetical predicted protein [Paramuricea clavata]
MLKLNSKWSKQFNSDKNTLHFPQQRSQNYGHLLQAFSTNHQIDWSHFVISQSGKLFIQPNSPYAVPFKLLHRTIALIKSLDIGQIQIQSNPRLEFWLELDNRENPAWSCQEIYALNPNTNSGPHWLKTPHEPYQRSRIRRGNESQSENEANNPTKRRKDTCYGTEVKWTSMKKLVDNVTDQEERTTVLNNSLQDTQIKCTNLENEIAKVHSKYEEKVKRSLEDVDTHRIRRNESVRRREEQIKSLEKSRSKLETVLHAQEGHIQSLQDRLEGSVSDRNKLGTNISKKKAIINQLETKILELEESTGETKKSNELIKKKDETIQRYEDRVREVELLLARTKTTNREKDEKIDALQKR